MVSSGVIPAAAKLRSINRTTFPGSRHENPKYRELRGRPTSVACFRHFLVFPTSLYLKSTHRSPGFVTKKNAENYALELSHTNTNDLTLLDYFVWGPICGLFCVCRHVRKATELDRESRSDY